MRTHHFLLLLLLLTSCTSTRITSRWRPPELRHPPFRKILVLGMVNSKDWSVQQLMERHLVEDLKDRGYEAASSFSEYGPRAFEGLTEQEAVGRINESRFDAVLTIVLLYKEKEKNYNQGYFYFSPFMYYYGNFWGYRMMMTNRIYEPGYWTTTTRYFWESNLFDIPGGKLIYSIQTQSFDPSSTESMAHAYGELIADELLREALGNR
ncbi:MAG: hypothetical protein ACKOAR_13680 [Bacteroidota bacterium]